MIIVKELHVKKTTDRNPDRRRMKCDPVGYKNDAINLQENCTFELIFMKKCVLSADICDQDISQVCFAVR